MLRIVILFLVSSFTISGSVFAAGGTYQGKSLTTDPKSSSYYNNDLKNNGALSTSAKSFAEKNPQRASEIIAANNGQCGIKCAAQMNMESHTLKPITADELAKLSVMTPEELLKAGTQTQAKDLNSSTVKDNLLGIEEGKLRKGDVDMNTIPLVIVNIISVLLGVAGTVAVFSLIYHAVQMQINSGITGDSSGVDKAKKGMIGSLIGFVIAISAWFLVTRAVDLLSTIS